MGERARLVGMGNEDNRAYFVFEKTDAFFRMFLEVLQKADIAGTGCLYLYTEDPTSVKKVTDNIEHIKNQDIDIDIFYGKLRVIVVVRSDLTRGRGKFFIDLLKNSSELLNK